MLEGGTELCVMTSGTIRMPLWSADNWDSLPMVKCDSVHYNLVSYESDVMY